MKMRKIILLLLFPLMADVLVACCNCDESAVYHYTVEKMDMVSLDNSGSQPRTIVSGNVPKKAYGIRIQMPVKFARNTKGIPFISNSAYALSCRCFNDQYLSKDSIVSVKVFSLNAFDNLHPVNTDITDYFKVNHESVYETIPVFLARKPEISNYEISFDVLLLTPPTTGQEHQFRVEIQLAGNRILTGTTGLINLF